MELELVIDSKPDLIRLALLRDGKLIELHEEKGKTEFAVGDIYYGKVRKVVPNLNAAFIDLGYEKDAFLHYLDLGPQFQSLNKFTKDTLAGKQSVADLLYFKREKDIDKNGKIKDVLSSGRDIVVQVSKEPISAKGPRLGAEVTLAGRFLVLVPFSDKVSISQKIRDRKERDRLRDIMKSILPKNFGVIIRTVAKNQKISEIDSDLKDLLARWKKMHGNLQNARPPKRILGELNRASSLLRDTLNKDFTKITVNDADLLAEMKEYIQSIAPEKAGILKQYNGKHNIFEGCGINRQIKTLFGKKVPLPSGGYLIIEHTEAMHVVDVNSGNRASKDDTQEKNALAVNLEAAEELARVMRLRDMGGIICVDFIDMHKKENNRMLYDKFREFMKADRAKHSMIPPSKFGIIEVTRQRVRPVTNIDTSEVCPCCKGTGKVQASITFSDEIEGNLSLIASRNKTNKITLRCHPFIAAYYNNGFFSSRRKTLSKQLKTNLVVEPIDSYAFLEYHFFDNENEEIKN